MSTVGTAVSPPPLPQPLPPAQPLLYLCVVSDKVYPYFIASGRGGEERPMAQRVFELIIRYPLVASRVSFLHSEMLERDIAKI